MSRAKNYFNLDNVDYLCSIDTFRGVCTASAMQSLSRILPIKRDKNSFKLGSTGARLKLTKIRNQDKFRFEIYGLSQFYKHSKSSLSQAQALCRYITTHQRFDIQEVDIALDMKERRKPLEVQKQVWYKNTLYIQAKDAKICIYDKAAKNANESHIRNLSKKLIRHEVTLRLAKNTPPSKPPKQATRAKSQSRPPLIRNNKRILKEYYNTKKDSKKYKLKKSYSVRDFYYKFLSKKRKNKAYHSKTKTKKPKIVILE